MNIQSLLATLQTLESKAAAALPLLDEVASVATIFLPTSVAAPIIEARTAVHFAQQHGAKIAADLSAVLQDVENAFTMFSGSQSVAQSALAFSADSSAALPAFLTGDTLAADPHTRATLQS